MRTYIYYFCFSKVDAETLTEVGDPQTAICDAVQRLNISLLVLGERGIGKIKRLILSYLQKGIQIYICFDAL
jgi:hypothetical protein